MTKKMDEDPANSDEEASNDVDVTPVKKKKTKKPLAASSEEDEAYDVSPVKKKKVAKKPEKPKKSKPVVSKGKSINKTQKENDKESSGEEGDNEKRNASETPENLLDTPIPPPPIPVMQTDGGERLIIRDIVVQNFKSYYGTQTIGPFHKNFTAVIGPNGSGKSNVIDSLLFVFGFKSSKIRSKKVTNLIHSSSKHDDIDFCSVEINFMKIIDKNDKEYEEVPGSRFSVSRTVHKSGTSTYRFNDKATNYKMLEQILLERGIDLIHNRFLILQGEVEMISMMKPKSDKEDGNDGMLEYLEDIIGTSRLKPIIDKFTEKLKELTSLRSIHSQRVRAADAEKTFLEGPVRETISLLREENTLIRNEATLKYCSRLKYLDKIKEEAPMLEEAEKTLKEKQASAAELEEARSAKKNEYDEVVQKIESATNELNSIDERKRKFADDETKKKNKIKSRQAEKEKNETKLKKEKKDLQKYEALPEKAEALVKELEEKLIALQEKETDNQEIVDRNMPVFESRTEADRQAKVPLEQELGRISLEGAAAKQKLAVATEELKMMMEEETKAKTQLADIERQHAELSEALEKRNKDLEAVAKNLPEMREQLDTLMREMPNSLDKERRLRDELGDIRHKIGGIRGSLKTAESGSRLQQLIARAKKEGFPGYFGRLGDLGAIDAKYDRAISNSMGNALDHYVVQTPDDATKLIEMVKKEFEGTQKRVNVCVIDQQFPPNVAAMNNKNHPLPRLFDLIKCDDPRFRNLFYKFCGDLLVTEHDELVEASRKVNRRYKIVDLMGSVVELSGAVSGGGTPNSGAMGAQVVNVDNNKLEAKLRELQQQYNDMEAEMNELNRKNRENDLLKRELQSKVERQSREANTISKELPLLKVRLSNMTKELESQRKIAAEKKTDKEGIADAEKRIAELTKERDTFEVKIAAAKEKFEEVNSRVAAAHKELIGKFTEIARAARDEKESVKKKISEQQASIASNDRNLKKTMDRIADLESIIEKHIAEDADLAAKAEEDAAQKEKLTEEKKELQGKLKELEAELVEVRKRNLGMDNEELALRKEILTWQDEVNKYEGQLYAYKEKIKTVEKEISAMKLNLIPDIRVVKPKVVEDDYIPPLEDILIDPQARIDEEQRELDLEAADDPAPTKLKVEEPPEEELRKLDRSKIDFEITRIKALLANKKQNINLTVIDDYKRKLERYNLEKNEYEEVKKTVYLHMKRAEVFRATRMQEFMDAFKKICAYLKEMYQMISEGGDAALNPIDKIEPFTEGIQFSVRPPRKSWKEIQHLSGGEKTLSSLALVFALHQYRPNPLYVMDEIDAALDYLNVSRIGHYIKDNTKNAQFIVISLRNHMFELSDRLLGIYKVHDCTSNIVVDPDIIMEMANATVKTLKQIKEKENDNQSETNENRKRQSTGSPVAPMKRADYRPTPTRFAPISRADSNRTMLSTSHIADCNVADIMDE